jgi:hypothetical protein
LKDLIEEARERTLQKAFNRNRSRLSAEFKAGRVEDAWRRIEKLAAETEDSSLLKGYLEMKQQIHGVVMSHRVSVAKKRNKRSEMRDAAQAFLAVQPANHKQRDKMESALAEAEAALAAP